MSVPAGGNPPNPEAQPTVQPATQEGEPWWKAVKWDRVQENLEFLRTQEEEKVQRRAAKQQRPSSPASPSQPANPPSDHPAVRVRTDGQQEPVTLQVETPAGGSPAPASPPAKKRATLKLW